MSNLLEKNHLVTIDLRLPRKQQLIFNSKAPSVTNFFFIGKGTEEGYINKKRHPTTNPKHIGSIQQTPIGKKQKKRAYEKLIRPHLEPNQSKKLIKKLGHSSIHNFV